MCSYEFPEGDDPVDFCVLRLLVVLVIHLSTYNFRSPFVSTAARPKIQVFYDPKSYEYVCIIRMDVKLEHFT